MPLEEEIRLFNSMRRWRAISLVLIAVIALALAVKAHGQRIELNPPPALGSALTWKTLDGLTIKKLTINDPMITIHCTLEPIVTKDGNQWLIRFKK
jgi:hypothetical protein